VSKAGSDEYECPIIDMCVWGRHEQVDNPGPSAQKAFLPSMVEQRQLDQFLVDRPCKLHEGDPAIGAQSHHDAFESLALYTKD
jgi:hypothetical protein